eukprot:scaffold181182_cov61-Attheya_sp.AAC.1
MLGLFVIRCEQSMRLVPALSRYHLGRITFSIALSLAALHSGSCNVIRVLYLFPSRWTNTWLMGEIEPARSGCSNASRRIKIV